MQIKVHPEFAADDVQVISGDLFGSIYTGFRNFDGFSQQVETLSVTHLRWPGGGLSERDDLIYDLTNEGVFDGRFLYNYNENRVRPGLAEMFDYCVDTGAAFTIIIPTAKYADDIQLGKDELEHFLVQIADGDFGPLPSKITFEMGNEYYNLDDFRDDPGAYGSVASEFIDALTLHLTGEASSYEGIDVDIAIQMGRTNSDDIAIRGQLSQSALRAVDMVSFHHLPIGLRNFHSTDESEDPVDSGQEKSDRVASYYGNWEADITAAGGTATDLELYLSAWSVGGASSDNPDPNLVYHDYGIKAAPTAVDLIWTYARLGVDTAAVWGVGVNNPNWLSVQNDGSQLYSPFGEIYGIMAASLPGLKPITLGSELAYEGEYMVHGFQGDDKLVFYISALDLATDEGSLTLDLGNLSYLGSATAISLNAIAREDESFDGVQSQPIVTSFSPAPSGQMFSFDFVQDYQVVELTISMPDGVNWNFGQTLSETVAGVVSRVLLTDVENFDFKKPDSEQHSLILEGSETSFGEEVPPRVDVIEVNSAEFPEGSSSEIQLLQEAFFDFFA